MLEKYSFNVSIVAFWRKITALKDIKVHYNTREPCNKEECSFEKSAASSGGPTGLAAPGRPHTLETSMLAYPRMGLPSVLGGVWSRASWGREP